MTQSQPAAALDHLRVLDLTNGLGQMCPRALGDLGADVIKIEPLEGDPTRRMAPFAGDEPGPERSLRFIHANRSKRSAVIDLDTQEGRDAVRALAERADILVEDRHPGYLARLGLGYDKLRELNPALVFVSITPFGQTGPHAKYRGGDLITQSTSGMMIANGDDGTRPCMAPFEITAQVGCIQAAFGALLAIRARRTTGRGQHVDLSLQEATISAEHPYIYRYSHENVITRREGKHSPFGAVNTYLCGDGKYANISVYNDGHFARLARDIMEHPVLSEDVWMNRTVRRENRELIDTLLEEYTETVECDELVERGQRIGIPVTPVMTVDGFVHHPHTEAREFFIEMDHPVIGRHRAPGPPVQLGASPWQAIRPAPLLGQHTEEVLQEINDIQPRRLDLAGAEIDSPAPKSFKPLSDIRVADMTRAVAGPVSTRYLATFGAETIKIEEAGATPAQEPQELNRCKLSCVADARMPGGKELIKDLVNVSDVVVENFKPGVMDKLGVGYEDLRQGKPDLIMIAMPGMGSAGPISDYLAYGQQVMGLTGLTHIWGHPESPLNTRIKMPYPDFVTGSFASLAVAAALEWRERTGEGQFMEIAQVEATAHLMGVAYMDYLQNGRIAQPRGNFSDTHAPHDVYPCLGHDAWCAIEVGTDEEWQALVQAMGRPAWAQGERYQTLAGRIENKDDLDRGVGEWTGRLTPRLLMNTLQKAGVPAGIVASGEDLYYDNHLRSRPGAIASIDHKDLGVIDYKGVNVHLSETPGWAGDANPTRGQDNMYVFMGILGLDHDQIQHLAASGTIT